MPLTPTHSPSNSSDTSSLHSVGPLPAPFDTWVESLSDEEIKPFGRLPETQTTPIHRRNPSASGSRISVRRQIMEVPFNNTANTAKVGVVVMSFYPPDPPGGVEFQIYIPQTWWRTQKWRNGNSDFTSKYVRRALQEEVLARIRGDPRPGGLIAKYRAELVKELEDCISALGAAAFDFKQHDEEGRVVHPASNHLNWYVTFEDLGHENFVNMLAQRIAGDDVEVEIELKIPYGVMGRSESAVYDWIMMQLSI